MATLRIIIDMDEVLADTYAEFGRRYTARFNRTATTEELVGNKYYDLDGAAELRNAMFEADFFRHLPVMAGAQEVVEELYAQHEVFIVTSATEFRFSMRAKWEWLQEHFPFIHYRRYCFCGDKSLVYGDYMIDDKVSNLKPFTGTGLLFDSPHNYYKTGFRRVHDWAEVRAYFREETTSGAV